MQTKHTFLFTLFWPGWTGFLFAFSMGPEPGVNDFGPTCAQRMPFGNPVNATGGTLTLTACRRHGHRVRRTH